MDLDPPAKVEDRCESLPTGPSKPDWMRDYLDMRSRQLLRGGDAKLWILRDVRTTCFLTALALRTTFLRSRPMTGDII